MGLTRQARPDTPGIIGWLHPDGVRFQFVFVPKKPKKFSEL